MPKRRYKKKIQAKLRKKILSKSQVRRSRYRRGKQPRYDAYAWTLDPENRKLLDLAETIATPHEIACIVVDARIERDNRQRIRDARAARRQERERAATQLAIDVLEI